jgi:carboxyl-terminal processing protease
LATKSTAQDHRVIQRFYALLQDGHTNVCPPEQLNISPIPLVTRLIDGRLLILGKRVPGVDLRGLHPGDEIVTIDGEPAVPVSRSSFICPAAAQRASA